MSWQEIWFFTAPVLAAIGMGAGTFAIIWLDKPRPKRKK